MYSFELQIHPSCTFPILFHPLPAPAAVLSVLASAQRSWWQLGTAAIDGSAPLKGCYFTTAELCVAIVKPCTLQPNWAVKFMKELCFSQPPSWSHYHYNKNFWGSRGTWDMQMPQKGYFCEQQEDSKYSLDQWCPDVSALEPSLKKGFTLPGAQVFVTIMATG